MINIIKAAERHFSDFGWLQTYWLFSFSSYYDPQNIQFGPLRVFNDDIVAPGSGFPTHPHEEMEIITIVLEGEMTHEDSMGNKTLIKAGDVQRMSAGTGLTHSEFNLGSIAVKFFQIWIFPDQPALAPGYHQKSFNSALWQNNLFPLASGQGIAGAVSFHADATIYRCFLEKGKTITFPESPTQRVFIYLVRGSLKVNGKLLETKDQARIETDEPLKLISRDNADFILISLPSCKGYGYDEITLKGDKKSGLS